MKPYRYPLFRQAILLLVLAFAGLALCVRWLPLIDPSEGRYGLIARQIHDYGDWVTPRLWVNGEREPFLGKPPLYFWAAAGTMNVVGNHALACRLPNVLAALGLLALTFLVVDRFHGRSAALIAILVLGSSGLFFALSGAVLTDMFLAVFVGGAMLALHAFHQADNSRERHWWSRLFFALLAGGFMTKGPVALILVGLPWGVWTLWRGRRQPWRDHAWLTGPAIFLALTVPWYVACERANPGFLRYFFLNENLLRYIRHDYGDRYGTGHLLPRGTAVLLMLAAAMPWSVYALWIVWQGRRQRLGAVIVDDATGFFLAGFAVQTLFWCVARQLLLTYLLPAVPAFAVWFALLARHHEVQPRRVLRLATAAFAVYLAIAIAGVCVLHHGGGKSTFAALREARAMAREEHLPGAFTFVREVPYSAYFYAADKVQPHAKEAADVSVNKACRAFRPGLIIASRRYLCRLTPAMRQQVHELDHCGDWVILAPSMPAAD